MEKQLIQKVIPEGLNQLNVMHFKDKDFEIGEVIASCRQLPMMSEHRVVVLREETGLCHSSDTKNRECFLCVSGESGAVDDFDRARQQTG